MGGGLIGPAAGALWPGLLLEAARRPLRALARYPDRRADAVLVLQSAPNASVDYYLRPRLEAHAGPPWAVVNFSADPRRETLLRREGLWIVVCRYVDRRWLAAIEEARPRLCGVSFFVDDDLPAVMTDLTLPLEARFKVARLYGRYAARLERVVSEVWASTPVLAARLGEAARLLPPVPLDAPQAPVLETPPLVVYHGTLTHGAERTFVRAVAERLERADTPLQLEVAGGWATRLAFRGLRKAKVRAQEAWPAYVAHEGGRRAAVFLAPLTDTAVNRARSAVKVFDAARLGAVAACADAEPYRSAVEDGVDGLLLPMDADAWATAVLGLLTNPERRLAIARAAYERVSALRAQTPTLALPGVRPCDG